MFAFTDRGRRPRRFFGIDGVVRRLRRSEADGSGRGTRSPAGTAHGPVDGAAADTHDRFQSERARFAATMDLELRLACRSEAMMRRELGDAARALLRRRTYRRLGFVRLSDYARERLGMSARTIQTAAWLAARLDELPAVSQAYDRSELSWAQAVAICRVAVAADQERWIALARRSTVDQLERLIASARRPDGVPENPEGDPSQIDGEPAVRWRFACPARVRALWRRALELASRAAGEPLTEWRAAEVVAAEASSGRPTGTSLGDRVLIEALRLARRARRKQVDAAGSDPADIATTPVDDRAARGIGMEWPTAAGGSDDSVQPYSDAVAPAPAPPAFSLEPPPPTDPFALDARLFEATRVLRTIEPKIGRLLRVVADQRIYRSFGYASLDDYVRERLGISARKAWALLKIERATLRSADFADAYRDGRLSWVRAITLLPVLERTHAAAWIARAETVTVRRLCDEVDWVLAARDAHGTSVSLAPPRIDSPLFSPVAVAPAAVGSAAECRDSSLAARLQIRAHRAQLTTAFGDEHEVSPEPASEVCDAEIRFTGPTTVVALLRDVLDAYADPYEPRWTALERLLRHVIGYWESTPRHPDPVFARDGWRCTVPACSSRRNLQDHHIRFRSRGGDNARDNRTTVCAAHHLHGIHDGTIQATGAAPHAIEWRLGVRPGAPPFLVCVGDRYSAAQADGTTVPPELAVS